MVSEALKRSNPAVQTLVSISKKNPEFLLKSVDLLQEVNVFNEYFTVIT